MTLATSLNVYAWFYGKESPIWQVFFSSLFLFSFFHFLFFFIFWFFFFFYKKLFTFIFPLFYPLYYLFSSLFCGIYIILFRYSMSSYLCRFVDEEHIQGQGQSQKYGPEGQYMRFLKGRQYNLLLMSCKFSEFVNT